MALTSTQLGCGRDIDQVWEHLELTPDAHERNCVYCQAARRDLQGLARATHDLRAADEAGLGQDPDPDLLNRILALARAEVRYGRRLPLDPPSASLGDTVSENTISEQAVAAVVRRAGDNLRGVQIRRCGVSMPSATGLRSDLSRVAVDVALRVSVGSLVAIPAAAEELRRAVAAAVRSEVGVDVLTIDITVEDLHDV